MTQALCLSCGNTKFGAIVPCPDCRVASCGDMKTDIAFSDRREKGDIPISRLNWTRKRGHSYISAQLCRGREKGGTRKRGHSYISAQLCRIA